MYEQRAFRGRPARKRRSRIRPLIVFGVVILVVAVLLFSPATRVIDILQTALESYIGQATEEDSSSQSSLSAATTLEESFAAMKATSDYAIPVIAYSATIDALDEIESSESSVVAFSLADEGSNLIPTLSSEMQTALDDALSPFLENGYDVSFLILDLQTGSGYSYNIDTDIYGASTIKGPVLIYGCQTSLEQGTLSTSTVNSNASNTIIYSDNTSYLRLRSIFEQYGNVSFAAWLESIGVDSSLASDTSYPTYSVRESAKLWMNTYLYFTSSDSNSEIVSWAQSLFSQTYVSMLRSGVDSSFPLINASGEEVYFESDSSDESDAEIVVYNKAGWINASVSKALCDAGIVIEGDNAYLVSVMTSAPDGNSNRVYVRDLVAAVWSTRSSLAPEGSYFLVSSSSGSE